KARRGMSRSTPRRLCWRAPRTTMTSFTLSNLQPRVGQTDMVIDVASAWGNFLLRSDISARAVLAPICHSPAASPRNASMPVIQVKDKQHSLKPGQTKIGAGAGVDVAVPGDAALGVQAILELGGDNSVVIRRASDAAKVKVNGVPLVDPTPL